MSTQINRARIAELMKIEEARFLANHKASSAAFAESK